MEQHESTPQAILACLTPSELSYLEKHVRKAGAPSTNSRINATFSHTDLVMLLAKDPSPIACDIIEKLVAKPIYMCARGETSSILLDSNNRVIPTPRGHYRGMAPLIDKEIADRYKRGMKPTKIDNRILISLEPNPKRKGSIAYKHYDHYTIGKSVTWHLRNTDLTAADIRWDEKKGFTKFDRASVQV